MANVSTDISRVALSYAYIQNYQHPKIIIMHHDFGSIRKSFQSTFLFVLVLFRLYFVCHVLLVHFRDFPIAKYTLMSNYLYSERIQKKNKKQHGKDLLSDIL